MPHEYFANGYSSVKRTSTLIRNGFCFPTSNYAVLVTVFIAKVFLDVHYISSLAVSMIGRMDCLKACYSGTPSDAEKPSPLSSEEREALLRLFLSLNGRSLPSSFNLSIETAIYHDITL